MAQADYFLFIEGIPGESQDKEHKDKIAVLSWSWGETNQGSGAFGSGHGTGKVSMQDFHFVMRLNKATPSLMKACATGQHIKTATMTARKAGKGQADYLTFKFHDILVSSYQTGGSEHSDVVPTDQVSFNFAKIEVEYKQQKPDGSYVAGGTFRYDLKANKSF